MNQLYTAGAITGNTDHLIFCQSRAGGNLVSGE
jgi:hypothetical protein